MIETEATTLGAICTLITDGKHGDCENEADSGFYFLSCKDVRDGKLNYEGARQITEAEFLDTHRRTQLEPNDLLITNSGTIGRMALARNEAKTGRTTFQKSVAILKPRHDTVCVEWLCYYLHAELERLIGFSGGTAQKNLLLRDLRAFTLGVPSLYLQRKIASILSAYDDLIENNTRRIAILEEMAQAIYREWFVNFRFPGHENVKLVDSELGQIPDGWEVKAVGDFGKVITGKTPSKKKPEYYNGDISFVKTPDMHGNLFCLMTTEMLSEAGRDSQSRQTVPEDSICISCIGTVGVISITTSECQTNQQINTIIPTSRNWREFIVLALKDNVPRLKQMGAAGATMDNISKGKLVGFPILHPTDEIVAQFSARVHDMFERIKLSQSQNRVLSATRDLLLPKLISGKLDVEDLDIDVGEPLEELTEAVA